MSEAVRVVGLKEFVKGIKSMDRELPKALRLAFNEAADIIVADAKPRVPRRSGKAAGSVKARSTQTSARVTGGGSRAPYYPFLDFGGRVGRRFAVRRPFLRNGRYIYAAYDRRQPEFVEALQEKLVDVAHRAGIEIEAG